IKIATVYEALVDTAGDFGDRRGSAFVAGTAYQILGRVGIMEEVPPTDLLTPAAIHPDIAAPLLFLIAGQNPDAREAGRRLTGALVRRSEPPDETFRRVEALEIEDLPMPDAGAQLVSAYAGPRHLARLLQHVAGRLVATGLATLPTPAGANEQIWRQWLRNRA